MIIPQSPLWNENGIGFPPNNGMSNGLMYVAFQAGRWTPISIDPKRS